MGFTAAAGGFVVFLLSVPVVELQTPAGWKVTYSSPQTCAVIGSSVDMHCTFTFPPMYLGGVNTLVETFWFLPGGSQVDLKGNPAYSGRVEYRSNDSDSTMTISDLRQSDSTVYQFRFEATQAGFFGAGGVTLSVTDLRVDVRSSDSQLDCVSSCPGHPSYIWLKNDLKIAVGPSYNYSHSFDPAGTYTCAVEGHEDFPSPAVYAPRGPSVAVTPSGDIMEGSSVTLNCSTDAKPAATLNWHKKEGNPGAPSLSTYAELSFNAIQPSHSGEYCCTAENVLKETSKCISVDVKYPPRLPFLTVSPSGDIMEGSSVNLTCSSDANPAANYTWYKGDQVLFQGAAEMYSFTSISSEDSGTYHCKSENQFGQVNSTALLLDVKYAPKLLSVSVSPSGDIMEGSSVNLTCSSEANPAATYTWYKEDQVLHHGPDGMYNFTSISSEDSGIYQCISRNQYGQINSTLFIDVQFPPRLPSLSVSPSADIVEGSSVTLTCSSDANPAATYTWYKEDQMLIQGPDDFYHFSSVGSEDSGSYYCQSENKYRWVNSSLLFIDVLYPPRLPSVSACPSTEIQEGSSVTLTCSSDANPAANYAWYKEDEPSPAASGQVLIITDSRAEHSGEYYCRVQNSQGWRSFTIRLSVVTDTGEWKLIAAGTVISVILIAIVICVLLWMRRRWAPKQPSELKELNESTTQSSELKETPNHSAQNQPIELEDDVHYSSIDFSKKPAEPLYSNTTRAPKREVEEYSVEYAIVKFNSSNTAPG